ncbi:MAG: hypothetical protein QW524_00120 [Candidatus Woesearchaeota archaeon]
MNFQKRFFRIYLFLIFLYSSIPFSLINAEICQTEDNVTICLHDNCNVSSFCKVSLYCNDSVIIFPFSEDFILLGTPNAQFLSWSVLQYNGSAEFLIVPLKDPLVLSAILVNKKLYTFNFTLPKMKVNETNLPSKSLTIDDFAQRVTRFNTYYLIFVGVLLGSLFIYELVYTKRKYKYGAEIDRIIEMIEKERQRNQQEVSEEKKNVVEESKEEKKLPEINLEELNRKIELNYIEDTLLNAFDMKPKKEFNFENKVKQTLDLNLIRKTIFLSKLKGIPKEILIEHLSKKYNSKKIKELVQEIYQER